jgi:PhnB protein
MLIYVEDADAFAARAIAAGAKETMPVTDQFDGDRRGTLTDPFGHVWLVASKIEEISMEEMRRRFDDLMKQGESK